MRTSMSKWCVATGVAALVLSACVDAPRSSSPSVLDDPLAQTFDALSRQSAASGDLARGNGFTFAALSVRSGVSPSRLEVRNGTQNELYDAFVTAVDWDLQITSPQRPMPHRTLIAWRRTNDESMRVLAISTPGDSMAITNPISLGVGAQQTAVYAAATAMYHDGIKMTRSEPDIEETWFGTGGFVKVKESSTGSDACGNASSARAGVTCTPARYAVRFDVTFRKIRMRPGMGPQVSDSGAARSIGSGGEQPVNGVKLRFSCIAPTSNRGCG